MKDISDLIALGDNLKAIAKEYEELRRLMNEECGYNLFISAERLLHQVWLQIGYSQDESILQRTGHQGYGWEQFSPDMEERRR